MIQEKQDVERQLPLTALDRCDYASCSAQAYVRVIGMSGDLLFCSHHYNKINATDSGRSAISNFAYEVIDERDRLIENRLVGEN